MRAALEPARNLASLPRDDRFRLISLEEIMQSFKAVSLTHFGELIQLVERMLPGTEPMSDSRRGSIRTIIGQLKTECEIFNLTLSSMTTERILSACDKDSYTSDAFKGDMKELVSRTQDELKSKLFFFVAVEDAPYYIEPLKGWTEVVERFPDAISDIEEANKCFALARYAAAVFHSVQVVEHGMIALGRLLKVKDPRPGFTATSNELTRILNIPYTRRPRTMQRRSAFLEQVQGVIAPLQTAWRNKINHADGKLTVLTADFTPEIAQEILVATRSLMRRLATDMPT
jgi:hypothetical protein